MKYLNSTHPILCVPMNQVSDLNLACAIHNAGAFPSFSCYNYYKQGKLHLETFFNECKEFSNRTSSTDILLSLSWEDFLITEVQDFLIKNNYKHIELFHRPHENSIWNLVEETVNSLTEDNFKIIFKILKVVKPISKYPAIILKGSDGAGRTIQDKGTLEENFLQIKKEYPNKILIPSGGIGNSQQVHYYLNNGAESIGIGTLFAASEESCVVQSTKETFINSTHKQLSTFGSLNSQGIVFKLDSNDNENMTKSLIKGVNNKNDGAIFAGKGITDIRKIMPVKDIIEHLLD